MGNKHDLKPCPFCGSKSVHLAENTLEGHFIGYSVHCNGCGVENRYTKHMKKAVNAWNARASGWIPCSERMPRKYDTVLLAILSKNGYDEPAYCVTIGCAKNETEFDCYAGDICDCEKVTHWMPLPNPPEEGKV